MSASVDRTRPAGRRFSWRSRLAALLATLALAAPLLPSAPALAKAAIRHPAKARLETAARKAALEAARKQEAHFASSFPRSGRSPRRAASRARPSNSAFAGVAFDPAIVAHTKRRPNSSSRSGSILANAVSPERVKIGAAKAARAAASGSPKPSETYGVDPAILMGVWGMESDFGAFSGSDSVDPLAGEPRLRPFSRRLFPQTS